MNEPSAPRIDPPAQPRDAATVVILRDREDGVEVYLVKRSRTVDFMAGAHVFPGGRLDPADASMEACAVRETFEEAALQLDPAALVPWVRWVTPDISPRRFDARFFLARAPEGQEPRVDGREATEGVWIAPARAIESWLDDGMLLAPATAKCLDALLAHRTVDGALAAAAKRPPPVMQPLVWNDKETGRAYISLPGDRHHPVREDALGGTILRFQLEAGRYRPVAAR
ncbi:MAG TPA: NUDIX domain-containing protein [Burkholderiales bacterium]|nr:NUDIX domain-containing protein [Burkholderiales bacterium]